MPGYDAHHSFDHDLGGHVFYPCGLAADKSGNVYVCDGSTQEVLVSRPFYYVVLTTN